MPPAVEESLNGPHRGDNTTCCRGSWCPCCRRFPSQLDAMATPSTPLPLHPSAYLNFGWTSLNLQPSTLLPLLLVRLQGRNKSCLIITSASSWIWTQAGNSVLSPLWLHVAPVFRIILSSLKSLPPQFTFSASHFFPIFFLA